MKKILLTILITSILLCSFTVFSFASEETILNVNNFDVKAYDNDTNATLNYNSTSGVFNEIPMKVFTINSNVTKVLLLSDSLNLNSDHEYNLSFVYACTNLSESSVVVSLSYYNSSNKLIKSDVIDLIFRPNSSNNNFSVDFKPNVSDLSEGYNIKLEISYFTTSSNSAYFRISENIKLIDKDDDSGFFEEIIASIKEIPEKIKNFFTDLGNTILEGLQYLFIPEDDYFSNTIDELFEFFENKFGLFILPITLTIRVLEEFTDLSSGSGIIPMINFEIFDIQLFNMDEINLKQLIETANNSILTKTGFNLYEFYLMFVDVLILLAFARLVKRKYNAMFDTGAFDEIIEIYNQRRSN